MRGAGEIERLAQRGGNTGARAEQNALQQRGMRPRQDFFHNAKQPFLHPVQGAQER